MDTNQLTQELDKLFLTGKNEDIEHFLVENTARAKEENAQDALLVLYNETMGFYRETGQYEKAVRVCKDAIALIETMGLAGTIPYATTLLNVANAYRAAGLLQESLDCFNKVLPIYELLLSPDDMYFASLYNNLSLLYQEMHEFAKAKKELEKALAIVANKEDSAFEIAVTHANLANTCMELGENEEAKQHALTAIGSFEEQGVDDAHYSAALSALGSLYYKEGSYGKARASLEKARDCVARYLGKDNIQYQRLSENIELVRSKEQALSCDDTIDTSNNMTGMSLCRRYYETYGKPMIEKEFPQYASRIAVGLVGKGSDCFGFDDEQSRDHDFGPRFVMWVTRNTYDEIGEELQKAYEALPTSFDGVDRIETFHGRDRAGVMVIEDFYQKTLGVNLLHDTSVTNWLAVEEYNLAAAVNGEVFRDDEGIFSQYRSALSGFYPRVVMYRRLAQACALFAQNGQYNLQRMRKRGQLVAAELAKAECMRQAMKITYLLSGRYAPHDKWLYKGLQQLESREKNGLLPDGVNYVSEQTGEKITVTGLLNQMCLLSVQEQDAEQLTRTIEMLAVMIAFELEKRGIVGRSDAYLDANTAEIMRKSNALLAAGQGNGFGLQETDVQQQKATIEALSLQIAKAEFEAFDKVQNEGGRASCQNDWATFRIMRMSQYLTWTVDMLLQYLSDFQSNYEKGRNLIQEKYARMMASTAPQEYVHFAGKLPAIPEDKQAIMEEIIRLQVQWMEEFAAEYPSLAENARMIHTSEDMAYDTSYETYLRGELGTYSDRMLTMYAQYIVEHAQTGRNVAKEIMENTVHFYGYGSLEEAAAKNI